MAAVVPTNVARAGTTYYVSPHGSDAAAGTVTNPWRTLGTSLTRLSAGDTLIVRGGTYVEQIRSPKLRAGTSALRIKVAAYPGERPVVQGLLWLHGPSYWTFDGINVTWSSANSTSDHMVKFVDGVGWTFINGEIWGAHSYAALLVTGDVAGQPANWRIANSCIHDTFATHGVNQDHNIYLNTGVGAGAGVLEHNLVFNAPNGRNLKLGPSGSTGGSSYVTVRYNTFYNASQPVSPSYDSDHNRFEYNIIGKSQGTYGLIHAYSLRGTDNVAANNIGFQATKLLASTGGGVMVRDGGGNRFPLDPRFDSVASCAGFHPLLSTATAFGRFAGVAAAAVAPSRTVSTPTTTATVASPKRATASASQPRTATTTSVTAAASTTTSTATTRPGKASTTGNGKGSAQPSRGGGKPPRP